MRYLASLLLIVVSSLYAQADYEPGALIIKVAHPVAMQQASYGTLSVKEEAPLFNVRPLFPAEGSRSENASLMTKSHAPTSRYFKVTFAPQDFHRVYRFFSKFPEVIHIEPNWIYKAAEVIDVATLDPRVVNDAYFHHQWALENLGDRVPAEYGLIPALAGSDVDVVGVWNRLPLTEGEPVIVAVLDTGVDVSHPDLAGRVWRNEGEIPDNGIDDEGNGFVDDSHGWNFTARTRDNPLGNNDPFDDHSHGTHCSGIIAANPDDGIGIAGLGRNVRIMPVKVLDGTGHGSVETIVGGITYAVKNGARVINLSLGSVHFSEPMREAVQWAHDQGTLVVAAAGNDREDRAIYPAGYDAALAVGATGPSDEKASFSNFGLDTDVFAPGISILSLFPVDPRFAQQHQWENYYNEDKAYASFSGTSMATPMVSGMASLIIQQNPLVSPDEVKRRILSTAEDIEVHNEGYTGLLGRGRINAAQALEENETPYIEILKSSVRIDKYLTYDLSSVPVEIAFWIHNYGHELADVQVTALYVPDKDFQWLEREKRFATLPTGMTKIQLSATLDARSGSDFEWQIPLRFQTRHQNRLFEWMDYFKLSVSRKLVWFDRQKKSPPKDNPMWIPSMFSWGQTPIVRDFDGDGEEEILLIVNEPSKTVLGLWDKQGRPKEGWPVEFESYDAADISPLIYDFTGDGKPEIFLSSNDVSLGPVVLFDLKGKLLSKTKLENPYNAQPQLLDIDGDGRMEIIMVETKGNVACLKVLRFNSAGAEGQFSVSALGEENFPTQLGDTRLAVLADGEKRRIILLTQENAHDPVLHLISESGGVLQRMALPSTTPGKPLFVKWLTLASLTPEGSAEDGTGVRLLMSIYDGHGTQRSLHSYRVTDNGFESEWSQNLGTPLTFRGGFLLNMDQDPDLEIAIEGGGGLYIFNKDGSSALPSRLPLPTGRYWNVLFGIAALDLNQDGVKDLIVNTPNDEIYAYDLQGNQLPGWPKDVVGNMWGDPVVVDLDGDGRYEILINSDLGLAKIRTRVTRQRAMLY